MAKIPTILEAGRADGKLIDTNSIFSSNNDLYKNKFQHEINLILHEEINNVAKQGRIFSTLNDVITTIKHPSEGDWVAIGETSPLTIYKYTQGSWKNTGLEYTFSETKLASQITDVTLGKTQNIINEENINNLNALQKQLNNNLSFSYDTCKKYLNLLSSARLSNDGIWVTGNDPLAILIPSNDITSIMVIKYLNTSYNKIAYLKDNIININESANFCTDTSILLNNKDFYYNNNIPQDCNYIYIEIQYEGVKKIEFVAFNNSADTNNTIYTNTVGIENNKNNINKNKKETDEFITNANSDINVLSDFIYNFKLGYKNIDKRNTEIIKGFCSGVVGEPIIITSQGEWHSYKIPVDNIYSKCIAYVNASSLTSNFICLDENNIIVSITPIRKSGIDIYDIDNNAKYILIPIFNNKNDEYYKVVLSKDFDINISHYRIIQTAAINEDGSIDDSITNKQDAYVYNIYKEPCLVLRYLKYTGANIRGYAFYSSTETLNATTFIKGDVAKSYTSGIESIEFLEIPDNAKVIVVCKHKEKTVIPQIYKNINNYSQTDANVLKDVIQNKVWYDDYIKSNSYNTINTSNNTISIKGFAKGELGNNVEFIDDKEWNSYKINIENHNYITCYANTSSKESNIFITDDNDKIIDIIPVKSSGIYTYNVKGIYAYIPIYFRNNELFITVKHNINITLNEYKEKNIIENKAIFSNGNIQELNTQNLYIYDITNLNFVKINYIKYTNDEIAAYALYSSDTIFNSDTCIYCSKIGAHTNSSELCNIEYIPANTKTLIVTKRRDILAKPSVFIDLAKVNEVNINNITNSLFGDNNGIINIDFNKYIFTKGLVQGEIGSKPIITSQNNWQYTKISVTPGNLYQARLWRSSLNVYTLQVNENDIITDAILNDNSYRYINIKDNTKFLIYSYPNDAYPDVKYINIAESYKLSIPPIDIPIQISSQGDIIKSKTMTTYKILLNDAKNIIFDTELYSGVDVVAISYWNDNNEFIGYEGLMNATRTYLTLYSKIPEGATWAYLSTRNDYACKIYVDSILCVQTNETYIATKIASETKNSIYTEKKYPYFGESINLKGYSVKIIGAGRIVAYVDNKTDHPEHTNLSGQGGAVYGDKLFRLHQNGYCEVFDLSNIDNITKINEFELGSYMTSNHANCCNFGTIINEETNMPYLYVSAGGKKCYVEKITTESSTLVQTIDLNISNSSNSLNVTAGDDGYLWAFGGTTSSDGSLYFFKFKMPDVSEGNVILTDADILDSWKEDDYHYPVNVWQGGMIYNGKLFILFGQSNSARQMYVYDTKTHIKTNIVPFDTAIAHEMEDCSIFNGNLLMVCNGVNEAYLLNF